MAQRHSEVKWLIQGNANRVRAPILGSPVLAPALTMKYPPMKTSSPDFNQIYVSLAPSRIWSQIGHPIFQAASPLINSEICFTTARTKFLNAFSSCLPAWKWHYFFLAIKFVLLPGIATYTVHGALWILLVNGLCSESANALYFCPSFRKKTAGNINGMERWSSYVMMTFFTNVSNI